MHVTRSIATLLKASEEQYFVLFLKKLKSASMTRQVGEVIRRGNIYHTDDILPIKFTDSIFTNSVKIIP